MVTSTPGSESVKRHSYYHFFPYELGFREVLLTTVAMTALAVLATYVVWYLRNLYHQMQGQHLYQEGLNSYQAKQPSRAVELFTEALQWNINSELQAKVLKDRAVAFAKNERKNEALEDLRQALACRPQDRNVRSQILLQQGKIKAAEKRSLGDAFTSYKEALATASDENIKARILFLKAQLHLSINSLTIAKEDLTEAEKLLSVDAGLRMKIFMFHAEILRRNNQLDEALEYFQKALATNAGKKSLSKEVYLKIAVIYTAKDLHQNAIQNYNQALECEPLSPKERADISLNLAKAHMALGDLDTAIEDLTAVNSPDLEDFHAKASLLEERAKIFEQQGKIDRAIGDLTAGIASVPSSAGLYIHRGELFLKQQQWNQALENADQGLTQFLSTDETRARLLCQKGIAQLNVKPENALGIFDEALACEMGEAFREELQKQKEKVLEKEVIDQGLEKGESEDLFVKLGDSAHDKP